MPTEIENLIAESTCRSEESEHSFTTTTGVKSIFHVKNVCNFWKKYSELVTEDEEQSGNDPYDRVHNLNIAEVLTKKTSPVVSTMFFKFNLNKDEIDNTNLFDEDFIKALVYSYQRAMAEILNISSDMNEFISVVLETPIWTCKNLSCFIIELRFPYCIVDKTIQKTKLRAEIINNLRRNNVISYLPTQPNEDWEQIIQEPLNVLPLYRSSNDRSIPVHILRNIYSVMSNIDEDSSIELHEVFDPMKHSYIRDQEVEDDFFENEEGVIDSDKWMPLFLSAYYCNKIATIKKRKSPENHSNTEYINNEILTDIDLAKIFLDMVHVSEFEEKEHIWQDMGKVLYKITKGSDEGLELFIHYSEKKPTKNNNSIKTVNSPKKSKNINSPKTNSPPNKRPKIVNSPKNQDEKKVKNQDEKKYKPHDKDRCKEIWPTFKLGNNLTIKTLAWMARQNNPTEYNEWHSTKWVDPAANECLNDLTEDDMAEFVYRFFWLDFLCTNIKSGVWWYYTQETHRWVPMDSAFKLGNGISKQIIPELEKLRTKKSDAIHRLGTARETDHEKKGMETDMNKINGLIKKFKTKNPRDKVISFCKEKFYLENFKNIANKGGLCTAWQNCVVEICGDYAIPRLGKPEDFLTKCGSVQYRRDFRWENETVVKCVNYIEQVFPDPELSHYALKDFASYLRKNNSEKIFRVWTGEGNNSKSMLVKLMQLWLGDLCIDLPDWVYTGGKKGGGGPSPELAQAEFAHLAITCEPDDGNDLSAGGIKRATGGDRFFGRMCNQDGGSIELTHKAIYMCNSIPNIPNVDKATKNRFGILPFFSTWVKGAPKDPEEQRRTRTFEMNEFFENELPNMAEAIFWIAVQYYSIYRKEGLIRPQIVIDYTTQHWRDNDPYESFIGEKMKQIKIKDDVKLTNKNSITSTDLYPHFKQFFKIQYPQSQIPAHPQFRTQMIQRIGKQTDRRWQGWKIIDVDE